jgi:uncharacterized protein
MRLDLSKIRTAHTSIEELYRPEAFRGREGDADVYLIAEPVTLRFDVLKTEERYRLAGSVRTVLELPCSRCLEPFRWPVDAAFDLVYHPQSSNVGEGEREVEEEDLATAFYENNEIDLGQLMREQFYLTLPMKPLCNDACHGLCPVCGINLNRETCDCKREWVDSRLAALRAIKDNVKRS